MADNALTQKAAEVIGQLQSLAPQATEVALEAIRYNAIANIASGIVFIPILAATIWFWRAKFMPWARNDEDIPAILAGLVLAVWTLACFGFVFFGLFDPWNYIAIAHPEVYAAHQVIQAATK